MSLWMLEAILLKKSVATGKDLQMRAGMHLGRSDMIQT